MNLTRKEFLSSVVTTVAGAAGALLLTACGGGDSGSDAAPPNCAMNGTTTNIVGNHGHTLTVSKADIAAGASKMYDITGTADHTHHVTIGMSSFGMLMNNMTVMTMSTTDAGHQHSISISCV